MTCGECEYFKDTQYGNGEPIRNAGYCRNEKMISDHTNGWEGRVISECPIDGTFASCDEERGHLLVGINFGLHPL